MAYELKQGMKVRSSDGASLGKIVRLAPDHFLVEKGFFFPRDYVVPISLLASCRDGEAWLSRTREQLEQLDLLHAGAPGGAEADARGKEDGRSRAWTDTSPEAARTSPEAARRHAAERPGAGRIGEPEE